MIGFIKPAKFIIRSSPPQFYHYSMLLFNSVLYDQSRLYSSYLTFITSMSTDPLQSVKNKIRLPSKYNVIQDMKLFPPLSPKTDQNLYELSQPLFNKTNQLVEELNQSFQIFRNENDYVFVFPDSLFPDVPQGERNQITYEQVMISEQENTFKNRLSEEQLQEIAEKGEFKVKSNIEYVTLPYVWKINETLFWGREKIMLVWKNSLAKIFGIFSQAKKRLFTFVPNALRRIKKIPKNVFEILVGAKSLRTSVGVDYEQEVILDFWRRIINDYYKQSEEWSSALWNYIFVYYDPQFQRPVEYSLNETINMKRQEERRLLSEKFSEANQEANGKMNKIRSVQGKFNQEWNKLKKKVILEIGEEVNNVNNSIDNKPESEEELLVNNNESSKNDDKIIELLAERKFSLSLDYMRQELPRENVPLDVINAIMVILRLFKVLNSRYSAKTKLLAKKRKQVEQAIKRRHPIKSLYSPFFSQKVEAEYKVIQTAINEEMHENLVKDKEFNELLSESQKAVLREYLKFRTNYDTLVNAKKNELRQLHSPSRTFYSNYQLLPPYQIIQANGYYSLKKISDNLTVDTNTDFWKLKLYWMRIKTWTINCVVFLIFLAWKAPTGLRCLYGKEDYDFEMDIHYQTGEIYYQKRKTVIGTFLNVMEGIRRSRANFQDTPDLGLLGKNISRYFNYMECYLFRFLFVGVIITLIGYPIAIVVLSTLSVVLVITVWAWVPIILLVTYTFNIFIYQFETALIPDRMIVRSIPIISIVYYIIKSSIIALLLTLNLILLAPLKAFFIFLFSFTQRCFRSILDKLLLFLFRKVGRTPSRDTSIARKISGPGMSKEFYMSINEEDVYVLMQSKLEQIFMQKFGQLTEQQIDENLSRANEMMRTVLKPFNSYSQGIQHIANNSNNLMQNYRRQHHNYMARYPNNPTRVRFTQEEIDSLFDNTVNIVRNFVTKYEIEKWIFEKYVLYEDMYDELTRSLWTEIFNCGEEIFEPLEKLDARFKLEDQYHDDNEQFNMKMKKNVNQIVRSMEGEVFLSHNKQRVAPFKHNLINREQQTEEISHVFDLWTSNSQTRMNLNRQNAHTAFIPNLNINEIAILHQERRERAIKANTDIVDL